MDKKERRWITCDDPMTIGSEGGQVLEDEEYDYTCRITRERCEKYDAITCGIYGEFVHTVYASPDESAEMFSRMKADLQKFCDSWPDFAERCDFYESFYQKY